MIKLKQKIMVKKDHAQQAAYALSDLNMAYAILNLCESSLFRNCEKFEQKVVKLCKAEGLKMLTKYDKHIAAVEK